MTELYHSLIHILGLCGEPHPSLFTVIGAIMAFPIKAIVLKLINNKR